MKTERKRLMKKLDDLCQEYIKLRDNHICQRCGGGMVVWSHVIRRSAGNRLRWDAENSKTLCVICHAWWHENEAEALEWFKNKFPERWKHIQEEKVKGPKQFKDFELLDMVEEYKQKYNGLLT